MKSLRFSMRAASLLSDRCRTIGIRFGEEMIWWSRTLCGRFRRADPVALLVPVPLGSGARRRPGRTIHGGGLPMRRNVWLLPVLVVTLAAVAPRAGAQDPPKPAAPAPGQPPAEAEAAGAPKPPAVERIAADPAKLAQLLALWE